MIVLDGYSLTLADVVRIAEGAEVAISDEAMARIEAAAAFVDDLAEGGDSVYGVTTGVGELRTVSIAAEDRAALQVNILRSHAAGTGPHLSEAEVRAMTALRLNSFCQGHSGVRRATVETLVKLLNRNVYPAIPEQGSLGASGDLAPLAHLALVLIGEGKAYVGGSGSRGSDFGGGSGSGRDLQPRAAQDDGENELRLVSGREALQIAGIKPAVLGPKEGLALINGTQFMNGIGTMVWAGVRSLLEWASAAAALTLEALRANGSAFDARIHRIRPHEGQGRIAGSIRRLVQGSGRVQPYDPAGMQDAYSLRCIPQVHGAIVGVADHVGAVLELEANSVTDNPLLYPEDGIVLNGGNFHGQPLAMALDYLAVGTAELANISERRIERLVNPHLSGLPAFLAADSGLHSGYMLAQYTAAALVSENKVLAHPASVDSIPTSAGQEDHVSMGAHAARKARSVLSNARRVVAIELCCAAQAIDLSGGPDDLGRGAREVYDAVRSVVPPLLADRVVAEDIEAASDLIVDPAAAQRIGRLVAGD